MDPTGGRIHRLRELVDVGGEELLQLPIRYQLPWEGMVNGELSENACARRRAGLRPFDHREAEAVEQDLGYLLR